MGFFDSDDDDNSMTPENQELQQQINQENQEASDKRAALFDQRMQIVHDQLGQNFGSDQPTIVGK